MAKQSVSSEAVQQAGSAGGPAVARSVEETGLTVTFLADLILKQILFVGEFTQTQVAASTGLSLPVVEQAVDLLRRERLVEVKGMIETQKFTFRFAITDRGRKRGDDLMRICRYVGPAPVLLEDYRRQTAAQSIRHMRVTQELVNAAFADLVIDVSLRDRLGPAIAAGQTILLYGPTGNGKTTIAETVGAMLPDIIHVPHALLVGGEVVTVFDPASHRRVEAEEKLDGRWVAIRRPVVKVGGEFTLRLLDIGFNPVAGFYEAPLQMKGNNGLFIIDDFGRQAVEPQSILNRWIISLDRRIDYLSLQNGLKFDIPFDQLVIFSTNSAPRLLLDDASLRRIRYKIPVDRPSAANFEQIFQQACRERHIPYDAAAFDHLVGAYYRKLGIAPDACHARDILNHLLERAAYLRETPTLSPIAIDAAWESCFIPPTTPPLPDA
ncbi:MAG: ATPase [Desulfuromonadales bacterium]